jgi:hypothetical protein
MSVERQERQCTCDTPTGSESRRCDYCKEQREPIEEKTKRAKRVKRKSKKDDV